MDGVFVSLVMNGSNTWVHIRQFAREDGSENNVVLSSTNFASLMFQLKAIEASFICDAQIAIRNNSIETIDKSVQTVDESVHAIDEFVQMNTTPDEKSVAAATSAAAAVAVTAVTPPTAKRPRAGTKGELRERLKKANKKRKMSKNDAITMTFAKALDQHIDGIVKSQCLGCMFNISYDRDGHDLCSDRETYVNKYFNDAMMLLEDAQVQAINLEQRQTKPKLPVCPPKAVLQADSAWCERVKKTIINL